MRQHPRSIVITGATRGLGRALALEYGAPGRILGLAGRNTQLLGEIATACEARGAEVHQGVFDLEDEHATKTWISAHDARSSIDLLIVNAGQFGGVGPTGALEPLDDALRQVRVNLQGAMTTIDAALMGMRRRGWGHIAIVTSLAALQPLADAPAYSASKAGLAAYGEALRELLAPQGVTISLIYPGHIRTQQTARHLGPMPMIMTAENAARIIRRGLDRQRTSIVFPAALAWAARAGRLVPWRIRAVFCLPLRFRVADES